MQIIIARWIYKLSNAVPSNHQAFSGPMSAGHRKDEWQFLEWRELLQLPRADLLNANYHDNRILLVFSEDVQGIQITLHMNSSVTVCCISRSTGGNE